MVITSIEKLKEEAQENTDFKVLLNGGLFSRKMITFEKEENMFYVFNYIDESEEELTPLELMKNTIIGTAIINGKLIKEG